jgi:hypothetical protein
VLQPIKIFAYDWSCAPLFPLFLIFFLRSGSFQGATLYQNPTYTTPTRVG